MQTFFHPRLSLVRGESRRGGQDGWLVWGRSSSSVADTKEPFAWTIASDNRRSLVPTWTAIFTLLSSRPTVSRNATPKRHEPKQIDRCHLLHDGSRETVV